MNSLFSTGNRYFGSVQQIERRMSRTWSTTSNWQPWCNRTSAMLTWCRLQAMCSAVLPLCKWERQNSLQVGHMKYWIGASVAKHAFLLLDSWSSSFMALVIAPNLQVWGNVPKIFEILKDHEKLRQPWNSSGILSCRCLQTEERTLSVALTGAALLMRTRTHSRFPRAAAQCRGVSPSWKTQQFNERLRRHSSQRQQNGEKAPMATQNNGRLRLPAVWIIVDFKPKGAHVCFWKRGRFTFSVVRKIRSKAWHTPMKNVKICFLTVGQERKMRKRTNWQQKTSSNVSKCNKICM